MSIIASFDKHPVYLDNDGQPLAGGKIHYYAIGTTTPKTVYSDYALTVPAANPQICGADGRTPTQIFLGTGQYTCVSRKFNGTDPNTAPDSDWDTVTSQWVEEGQPTPSIASLTDAVFVTTIANLRLIDPTSTGKTNYYVMGYWSEGDMFPRMYHWDASSLTADNKGTVIRNPSISTGAFILDIGNTDVVDCRIFGIIHNRASSNNSAISSMVTAVQNNAKLPQTIYFPRGTYDVVAGTQYFDCKVIFDQLAQFKNTGAGTYLLGIRGDFDNYSTNDIKASASVGDVTLAFSNQASTKEVDVRWFGCKCDSVSDDGPSFEKLIANTILNYPIKIAGRASEIAGDMMLTTLSNAVYINNPVHFYNNSRINLNQTSYGLYFTSPNNKNHHIKLFSPTYGCFAENNLGLYIFSGFDELNSSFFDGDMSKWIKALNQNINTQKTTFVFDCDCTFSDPLALIDSNKFVYKWVSGYLSCNTANPVHLPAMDAPPNAKFINSAGFYVGGYTHADWFPNIRAGILSALSIGATLDMDGNAYTGSATPITITEMGTGYCTIKNGTINMAAGTYNWITLNTPYNEIIFDGVYVACGASNINAFILGTGSLGSFVSKNSNWINFGTTSMIMQSSGGTVGFIDISGSNIRWRYGIILPNGTSTTNINIHDNDAIQSTMGLVGKTVRFTNNYVYGGADYAIVVESDLPSKVSDNTFYECYLKLQPYSTTVNGNIVGNSFYSTDTQSSIIQIATSKVSSRVFGLVVKGNSFDGNHTAFLDCITCITEGSGTWYASGTKSGHYMDISGNSGTVVTTYTNSIPTVWKRLVRSTSGNTLIKFAKSDLSYTSVGDSNSLQVAIPYDVFVIPGTSVRMYATGTMYYDWNGVSVHYFMSEKLSFTGVLRRLADTTIPFTVRVDFSLSSIDSDWEAGVTLNYSIYTEQD